MQFHGGAHCGNTAPRLTAAAEKNGNTPPRIAAPAAYDENRKNPTGPGAWAARSVREPPGGHSCRTQHLGSGGQDYAPSERPSTADFAQLRRLGVKFFHLQFSRLRDRRRNTQGCPKRPPRQEEFFCWNTTSCVRRVAPAMHRIRTRYTQVCPHAWLARPAELGARLAVRSVTGRNRRRKCAC